MTNLFLYLKNNCRSKINGAFVKFLFLFNPRVKIGKFFYCDSIPDFILEDDCEFIIGDNVFVRRDVEIRIQKKSKINIDSNVRIDRGVRLLATNSSTISLGEQSRVGMDTIFNGGDCITVGKKCLISSFVILQTSMHKHKKGIFIQDQHFDHAPIILGDDVWLGAHVIVFPGCTLESGSIVGSNSVVTKNVEKETIVGGSPAKFLKIREF